MPTPLRPPTQLAEVRRRKEEHLAPAIRIRESFLALQVCRRNDLTDDEALDLVGRASGTSNGWVPMTEADLVEVSAMHPDEPKQELHIACEDYPEQRTHFVAIC